MFRLTSCLTVLVFLLTIAAPIDLRIDLGNKAGVANAGIIIDDSAEGSITATWDVTFSMLGTAGALSSYMVVYDLFNTEDGIGNLGDITSLSQTGSINGGIPRTFGNWGRVWRGEPVWEGSAMDFGQLDLIIGFTPSQSIFAYADSLRLQGSITFNENSTVFRVPDNFGVAGAYLANDDEMFSLYNIGVNVSRAVPEPGTLGLLGIGLAGLTLIRRKRLAAQTDVGR